MNDKIIDLSLEIYHGAPTFAWDPKCSIVTHNTIETIGYNISQISMSTHQGTHIDAPYHFINDGISVDKIDLQRLIGEVLLIDLTYKKEKEPIGIEDFSKYEEIIKRRKRIIYRTKWDRVFPDRRYFSDFPYMTVDLARWLTDKGIELIGMDTPTPNPVDWLPIHKVLLGAEIFLVEGLANLERLKDKFLFFVVPLKLKGCDGSPVRAFAIDKTYNE